MIVGRVAEIEMIMAMLAAARAGTGTVVCFEGEAGIGKSTLLSAALDAGHDFRQVRTVGVEGTMTLGYGGLLDVISTLRDVLPLVPNAQREALTGAVGWSVAAGHVRHLVAAGLLSLLSAAAADRPVLVVVDDLHWVDPESQSALLFASRRLGNDAVVVLMAGREWTADPGLPRRRLNGLDAESVRTLLPGVVSADVVGQLMAETAGNPLAVTELVRSLGPEQLRGSAPLPDVLPIANRLADAFRASLGTLSGSARRALVLMAAHPESATVSRALAAEGLETGQAIEEAERSGAVVLRGGKFCFRHPLLRAVVWADAAAAERRSAHRTLASCLDERPGARVRHLSESIIGHDDELARSLFDIAAQERRRSGHAQAAALTERAAEVTGSASTAATYRAAAVEDAFQAGNGAQVRRLAAAVLEGPADDQARGRVLLWSGILEQYAGSVPRSRELLEQAASIGSGDVRMRAVAELAGVGYRLGLSSVMWSAARLAAEQADPADPEQQMLASYTQAAALAVSGQWQQARAPAARALQLLETHPRLRDEPQYLAVALLTTGWMGEPLRAEGFLDRRMDRARTVGALGVLPLPLTLVAGGAALLGRHDLAYACAGEAAELGAELGYVADVAIAHELLAWQAAARGVPEQALRSLRVARRLSAVAGVAGAAVHVDLVDAFAALCRGDLPHVVVVLERRLQADDGRLPRGDYPLSVAPDLVEAYLGLGRVAEAAALAERHTTLHRDNPDPEIQAHRARLLALTATDAEVTGEAFGEAHRAHESGHNAFESARTRLLHGSWLRRAGQRVAAREQLELASTAFGNLSLDGWVGRAEDELRATGRTSHRSQPQRDQLTAQEMRVALQVARGLTNREIAAALFLSPKTVEHHITSALRKRGMRSRTELAIDISGTITSR